MNPQFSAFKEQITNPVKYHLFMLSNLPAAWFSGLRISSLNEQQAVVSLKQKWFNKNPFQSVYFAVLAMAAEMSTGLLSMGHIHKRNPAISMLVTKIEGTFIKKATGKILFTCNDGEAINKLIDSAILSGEPVSIVCCSTGRNENNEVVAEFYITWSFKARTK